MRYSTTGLSLVIAIFGFLPAAWAHGHMSVITCDGKAYDGPQVGQPMAGGSVIRMIDDVSPVKDLTSPNLSCGQGAANETAALVAPVKLGSSMSVAWVSGDNGTWPHNVGPLMTYLASCNGNCSSFNSLDAKWIKIDEAGIDNSTGNWVQTDTLYAGKPYSFKFPSSGIPTGQYLLRNEIIALHNAQSQGGAEFYPACAQVVVPEGDDSVNSLPTANAVSFPGAYSPTDPGILINVYNPGATNNYVFPGPPLAFSSSSSGSGNSSSSGANNTSSDGGSSSNDGSGSSSSNGSSNGSSSGSNNGSASVQSATTTATAADASSTDSGEDCDQDGNSTEDDSSSNAGMATVTQFVTVTVQPHHAAASKTTTLTDSVTVTANAAAATGGGVVNTTSNSNYRPKRRSRMMARRHTIYWTD